jgi:hypothetical protein
MGSDGTVLLALLETAVDKAIVDDEGGLMDAPHWKKNHLY